MRYIILGTVMLSELLILAAVLMVGFWAIHDQNWLYAIVCLAGIWAWNDVGVFFSWRPSNIRKFLKNTKSND